MTPIRILAPTLLAVVLASCASQKANQYDTPNSPTAADTSAVNAPVTQPANPVYDTPAAYEESSATVAPTANNPNIQASPSAPAAPTAAAVTPKAPSNGAAIIHTVVAGDTLSGISAKYKVPAAAIKQANGMTKDTVVLGKKMVIPPTH